MSKREKIKFEDLEKLGSHQQKPFTENDLLDLVSDSEKLAEVLKTRRVEFFSSLFTKLSESDGFRQKVISKLKKNQSINNEN